MIWLGGAAIPNHIHSWIRHHRDWELRLWKCVDLDRLHGASAFRAAKTLSEKSDVMRYELLGHFGGVYVDADVQSLRPLDPLIEGIDCFAGTQDGTLISTSVLGATPGHPFIQTVIREMPIGFPRDANPDRNSGPRWLTRLVEEKGLRDQITVFPQERFYALVYGDRENPPEDPCAVFPNAFAIHHWMHSWVDGNASDPDNDEVLHGCPTRNGIPTQRRIANKLAKELRSFQECWRGGYYNDIDRHNDRDLRQVLDRCIRGRVTGKIVLEIGPGRGAWTKRILDEYPRFVYCLDALSAEHNDFWRYVGDAARSSVEYHQVTDFECAEIPDNSIDFLFSFDAFCHISLTGARRYLTRIFEKMKPDTEGFIMFADAEKYVRHCGWDEWVHPGDGVDPASYDGPARPFRWYWIGVDRFCELLESAGFEVISRDIDANPRDPIGHFRRREQPVTKLNHVSRPERVSLLPNPIAMVTLATGPDCQRLADLDNARKEAYCAKRGYRFEARRDLIDPTRHPVWNKMLLIREVLKHSSWVLWCDVDTILWNDALRLESFLNVDTDTHLILQDNHQGLNAGVFFIRQCPWSFEFLDHVTARRDLEEHPWREQQAIIEARADPRWERSYLVHPHPQPYQGFHGYWYFGDWDKLLLHFADSNPLAATHLCTIRHGWQHIHGIFAYRTTRR